MKIDLEKAKEEFIKYTSNYDLTNSNIDRKKYHSFRVMEISKEITTDMKLKQEDIELAALIGLLHDIARFEQYKQFKTFNDLESFDHGNYGVKILFEDGMIRKFVETNKYDEIIKKSIKNHNKFKIETGLTEIEELFAKIIRDADKIDIIYEGIEIFWKNQEEEINNSVISEKIWNQIKEEQLVKREKGIKLENIDSVLSVIAFIYDINFKESFKLLQEKNYINLVLNRFDLKNKNSKNKIKKIKKNINGYIQEKIKDGK